MLAKIPAKRTPNISVKENHVKENHMEDNQELYHDPWLNLAAAIVKRAVRDYRLAVRRVLRHPEDQMAKDALAYEKNFFYSRWFEQLSDLNGPELVRLIEKYEEADYKEGVRKKLKKKQAGAEEGVQAQVRADESEEGMHESEDGA